MTQDCIDFLETLLWLADNPDEEERPFEDKSPRNFSQPFIDAVETYLAEVWELMNRSDSDLDDLTAFAL